MTHESLSTGNAEQLERPVEGRVVAGVASGIARHLCLDATLVRLAFVAACLLGGVGFPLYLAAWLLMPDEGTHVSIASDLLGHAHAAGRTN